MSDLLKQALFNVNAAVQSLERGEMNEETFAIVSASVAQAKALIVIAEQLGKLVAIGEAEATYQSMK